MGKFLVILCAFVTVFSLSFSRDLMDILDSKLLVVGIRNVPSEIIYFPQNETAPGFCYELVRGFSDYLGVYLKIVEIEALSEYFNQDIFDRIDMIADILTVTEERKNIMTMIPFVENTELFVGRMDIETSSVEDFKGKRILTFESFTYFKTVIDLLEEKNINYVINKVIYEDEKLKFLTDNYVDENSVEILMIPSGYRYSTYFVYLQLIQDNADIGVFDSLSFAQKYFNTLFLRQEVKPLFPAKKEIGYLAFGFSKDSKLLPSEFQRYLENLRESGKYDQIFQKYVGIDYKDYLEIIGGLSYEVAH